MRSASKRIAVMWEHQSGEFAAKTVHPGQHRSLGVQNQPGLGAVEWPASWRLCRPTTYSIFIVCMSIGTRLYIMYE